MDNCELVYWWFCFTGLLGYHGSGAHALLLECSYSGSSEAKVSEFGSLGCWEQLLNALGWVRSMVASTGERTIRVCIANSYTG